jgi:hypothetical protein
MDGWLTVFSKNKIDQIMADRRRPRVQGSSRREAWSRTVHRPRGAEGVGQESGVVGFMARQSTARFYKAGGGVVIPTIADSSPLSPPRVPPEIIMKSIDDVAAGGASDAAGAGAGAVAIEQDGQLVERPFGC